MNDTATHFIPAQDLEELQATVLGAAIQGNEDCRNQLSTLSSSFEEPYRTVAFTLHDELSNRNFADSITIKAALAGKHLTCRNSAGRTEEVTPQQVMSLLCPEPIEASQAQAYLSALKKELDAKRRADLKKSASALVDKHGDNPSQLLSEMEKLVAQTPRNSDNACPSELQEFLPYFQELSQLQTGTAFLGLDSGFPLLNQVCNGLDAGLTVVAAPPSLGKTTLIWQICQQVAKLNKVPVIFVSMEQSKSELRVKALARMSKLNTRHISRGRFRSDDPQALDKLKKAAKEYLDFNRYLTIIEGDDRTTVDSIAEIAAAKMAQLGAKQCLIVLDYLQILPLQHTDVGRANSVKDKIDLHVSALRRLARRLHSPVIAISSENRQSYDSKSLSAFKESGGIEYSADIAAIMTLDKEATRSADGKHRVVDFNIVKNRNGELAVVKFKFYPERAEFIETQKEKLPIEGDDK